MDQYAPVAAGTAYPPARERDWAHTTLAAGTALVATLLGIVLLAWLILFVTKGRFLKHRFETYLGRASEREVRVAGDFQLYFDPIDLKFRAEGLTIANPKWASKPNFWESRVIDTRVATLPLIFGRQRINALELADGHVDAEWDAAHKANTWTLGDPNAPAFTFKTPDIVRATVSGTTLRYKDPALRLLADIRFQTVDVTAKAGGMNGRGARLENAIRFSGDGSIRGEAFTLTGAQTSPNDLMAGGRNRFELHARAASTQMDVAGTLPGATVIEGADLTVGVRGRNLRDLFDLVGIAVPDTRAYRLTSHLTKQGGEYRFTNLRGNYGNSDIGGTMTIAMPDNRLKLTADLASRRVDMVDIGPFIGYNPNALAAKGATSAVKQTDAVPRLLPDAPLRVDAIDAFDADVHYTVKEVKQQFVPVSNIVLGLDLDHKLLKLSPLNFDLAGGHLASDISIDARVPAVVTQYDIRLSPTPMATLFRRFGVQQAGTTGTIKARIDMKGTGDTVRQSLATSNGRIAIILPQGTFWAKYIQLAEFDVGTFVERSLQKRLRQPVNVNCGLIAFTVKDGVAAADPILIDTQKNVMTAKGGFSFRDESLDMAFRADAKKFSAFSGQSPVGFDGHFAKPGIQIVSPQLVTRGGAAVALGVVATPLAAVLAFIDPGDAKSAACGPVLAGATASAQRTTKGEPRKDVGTKAGNHDKAEQGDGPKKKKFLGIF